MGMDNWGWTGVSGMVRSGRIGNNTVPIKGYFEGFKIAGGTRIRWYLLLRSHL